MSTNAYQNLTTPLCCIEDLCSNLAPRLVCCRQCATLLWLVSGTCLTCGLTAMLRRGMRRKKNEIVILMIQCYWHEGRIEGAQTWIEAASGFSNFSFRWATKFCNACYEAIYLYITWKAMYALYCTWICNDYSSAEKDSIPLHFPMIVWHACVRAFILTSGSIRDDQTGTITSQHLDPVLNFENPVQDQLWFKMFIRRIFLTTQMSQFISMNLV